ncbi:hypothetical protein [Brachybacterium kimchii]|uniref:Uncharacterized protein n=1 Tax=Brachybacterium kimchii TaxID=2942909 RepID=A0ABY4N4U1_9MICO|nr:hypothetical protein [Brachybacterium kimchii]UQN29577.1 hypothetical protein M4486_18410 [Brachybacterium kimchii]
MEKLPADIDQILKALASWAAGYSTGLKWNEVAKLKSDLMENRAYWRGFAPVLVRDRCLELGMEAEDAEEIHGYVTKAQAGKRLVPEKSYKGFTFRHEGREPYREQVRTPKTSTDW